MELPSEIRLPVEVYARVRGTNDPFASLLICQRSSLLHFPMRTKALFDDIQSYFVLFVPVNKTSTKQ